MLKGNIIILNIGDNIMDERIEKAISYSNYKLSIQNQRENLKTKLTEQLVYATGGGLFDINQELISFVSTLASKTDSAVLLDKNKTPVMIENLSDFLDEILSRYMDASNSYLQEYEKLRKARSVKQLIEIEE